MIGERTSDPPSKVVERRGRCDRARIALAHMRESLLQGQLQDAPAFIIS
ncbi:hypothetical protein [Bradyrhizobium sp. STM 3809]|nr:hypothetical protein [Bradyrhizobium sp. STM 3809]